MPDKELKRIADKADMIIAGYSFTKDQEGFIRVLNLENPEEACLLQRMEKCLKQLWMTLHY